MCVCVLLTGALLKSLLKSHIAILAIVIGLIAQGQFAVGCDVGIGIVGIAEAAVVLQVLLMELLLLQLLGAASLHSEHCAAARYAAGRGAAVEIGRCCCGRLLLLLLQQHGQVVVLLLRVVLQQIVAIGSQVVLHLANAVEVLQGDAVARQLLLLAMSLLLLGGRRRQLLGLDGAVDGIIAGGANQRGRRRAVRILQIVLQVVYGYIEVLGILVLRVQHVPGIVHAGQRAAQIHQRLGAMPLIRAAPLAGHILLGRKHAGIELVLRAKHLVSSAAQGQLRLVAELVARVLEATQPLAGAPRVRLGHGHAGRRCLQGEAGRQALQLIEHLPLATPLDAGGNDADQSQAVDDEPYQIGGELR